MHVMHRMTCIRHVQYIHAAGNMYIHGAGNTHVASGMIIRVCSLDYKYKIKTL